MRPGTLMVLFSLILSVSGLAQISLAPSFVFIDENTGVGNLFVSNKGDKAQEVSITFSFGYPGSDSEGNLVMQYEDQEAYSMFALDTMIRAFPRSFTLQGGEQRTVRIQVLPAHRRKDGFFFTRMKVLSKPETAEVSEPTEEGISTRISFNFEQVTAVFYRKGPVSTGVEVTRVETSADSSSLDIKAHLKRTGNAPFLGSMVAKLKDSKGQVVAESQITTTAYFDVIRRISLPLEGIKAGAYNLELIFETRRNDMMAGDLVQAPPFIHQSKVTLR